MGVGALGGALGALAFSLWEASVIARAGLPMPAGDLLVMSLAIPAVLGGLFGLMGSLALLPFVTQPGLLTPMLDWIAQTLTAPDESPPDPAGPAFILGAIYIAVGQLIGFLVCWVGWHIAKR